MSIFRGEFGVTGIPTSWILLTPAAAHSEEESRKGSSEDPKNYNSFLPLVFQTAHAQLADRKMKDLLTFVPLTRLSLITVCLTSVWSWPLTHPQPGQTIHKPPNFGRKHHADVSDVKRNRLCHRQIVPSKVVPSQKERTFSASRAAQACWFGLNSGASACNLCSTTVDMVHSL